MFGCFGLWLGGARPFYEIGVRSTLQHEETLAELRAHVVVKPFDATVDVQWTSQWPSTFNRILVAFALIFPNSELFILFLPFPIKAKFLVPILILGDLFFGFSSYSVGPIAHFAHIGGALTGFLIMWYWKKNQFNKNRWDL